MGDYTLNPHSLLLLGMTGSGKSTFGYRLLVNAPNVACRFIFDDEGKSANRLKIRPAFTANELEAALALRWVLFNPSRMFPGDNDGSGFRFFCQWVLDASKRGPGKKYVMVDEIWRHCSPGFIPKELAALAQVGREENLELISCTQEPHRLNSSLRGMSTEAVFFRLDERLALQTAVELGRGKITADEIANLPLGSFIAINRLSRSVLRGKMF